jgi:hypothetical protein
MVNYIDKWRFQRNVVIVFFFKFVIVYYWQGWETSRNLQICYLMHAWDEKKVVQHMKEANKVLLSFMFFFSEGHAFHCDEIVIAKSFICTHYNYTCMFMGIKILDFYTRLFVFVLHTIVTYFSCLTRYFYSTRTLIWIYKKRHHSKWVFIISLKHLFVNLKD